MTENIRILIADDHAVVREGLRALIEVEPGMELVGEAGSAEDAFALALAVRPDLMLLDIDLYVIGGSVAKCDALLLEPARRIVPRYSYRSVGARVRIVAGSEPPSGSVRPKQPIASPRAIAGSQRCFCSSLP